MKDPSSPMDVCPFCGKSFKRLKSHLPHCKMAENKNKKPNTDEGDKNRTTNQASVKGMDAPLPIAEKQNPRIKETGPKRQVRQDKTVPLSRATPSKVGEDASRNTFTQRKVTPTIGHAKEAPQATTGTNPRPKEQDHVRVAPTEPNSPIQQGLERTLAANMEGPRMSSALQTVRDQVWTGNVEVDPVGSSSSEQMSELDTVKNIGVQGHFQVCEPKSLVGSTKASMVFGRSTSFPQERVRTETACHEEAEMGSINVLETVAKSMENKMDVPPPPKTVQRADGPLGLQWLPQLYSNYVQQRIVPGRQDQWDPYGRGTNPQEPTPRRLERCESILENQRLMDVRLGDLPNWFAHRKYSPKAIPKLMEQAWGRYYNKYINVKRGGVGGLTMLLAGYCLLSYSWNYDHIKQDRWRKYH